MNNLEALLIDGRKRLSTMSDVQQIAVTVGCEGRDDRVGDFYNAISEVVSYFKENNYISSDEIIADILKLKARYLEEC